MAASKTNHAQAFVCHGGGGGGRFVPPGLVQYDLATIFGQISIASFQNLLKGALYVCHFGPWPWVIHTITESAADNHAHPFPFRAEGRFSDSRANPLSDVIFSKMV